MICSIWKNFPLVGKKIHTPVKKIVVFQGIDSGMEVVYNDEKRSKIITNLT